MDQEVFLLPSIHPFHPKHLRPTDVCAGCASGARAFPFPQLSPCRFASPDSPSTSFILTFEFPSLSRNATNTAFVTCQVWIAEDPRTLAVVSQRLCRDSGCPSLVRAAHGCCWLLDLRLSPSQAPPCPSHVSKGQSIILKRTLELSPLAK